MATQNLISSNHETEIFEKKNTNLNSGAIILHSPYLGVKIVFITFVVFCFISDKSSYVYNNPLGVLKLLITGNHIMFRTFHV